MNEYIDKELEKRVKEINQFETIENKESYIYGVVNAIIKNTNLYYETEDENLKKELKESLIDYYNIIIYYTRKENKYFHLMNNLRDLPSIYLIDQQPERFNINEELLGSINVEEGLTNEQAEELLKWTSNNTRDNLNIVISSRGNNKNVYDNASLLGACGFSQFSTLYPLQQLGLDITVNNIGDMNIGDVNGYPHAYGTVIIPIKEGEKIIPKRYLIDCTYRQFFTIENNVFSCYYNQNGYSDAPEVGFFVMHDEKNIEFAKKVLKDGYFEATDENLKMYFKPFYLHGHELRNVKQANEEFNNFDIIDMLNNKQEEFDYDETEFENWNMNLKIPNNMNYRTR